MPVAVARVDGQLRPVRLELLPQRRQRAPGTAPAAGSRRRSARSARRPCCSRSGGTFLPRTTLARKGITSSRPPARRTRPGARRRSGPACGHRTRPTAGCLWSPAYPRFGLRSALKGCPVAAALRAAPQRILADLERAQLGLQLQVAREALRLEPRRAPGVASTAQPGSLPWPQSVKRHSARERVTSSNAAATHAVVGPELELAQARRVDQQRAARQLDELAVRGGVAPALVGALVTSRVLCFSGRAAG